MSIYISRVADNIQYFHLSSVGHKVVKVFQQGNIEKGIHCWRIIKYVQNTKNVAGDSRNINSECGGRKRTSAGDRVVNKLNKSHFSESTEKSLIADGAIRLVG